jgi:lipopolysaccharide assembly protein B
LELDLQWLLLALPIAFGMGWLASRFDWRQMQRDEQRSPKAYFKGLTHLLNEQPDQAIDAFIEVVQNDPDTSELHFALGNLFRKRGEFERAVRVHQHLLARADVSPADRERAQYALAQDYMRAGLFDRAEAAFTQLLPSPHKTEAQFALLQLHERARNWPAAIDVANALNAANPGAYDTRIAHHWCEIALDAGASGDAAAADAALQRARACAGASARPWVITGQHHARAGRHADALAVWSELRQRFAAAFVLVAGDYAASAKAQGQTQEALAVLRALQAEHPSRDLMAAIDLLDTDTERSRARHAELIARQHTLGAAAAVLHDRAVDATDRAVIAIVEQAAAPLARYRCAACGFEAQRWFWQCPGCLGWDTFPPQRLESQ